MGTNKLVKSKEKGFSLFPVMFAVLILLFIGGGLLSLGLQGRVMVIQDCHQIEAQCAADAGLTRALFEINQRLKTGAWRDTTLQEFKDSGTLLEGKDTIPLAQPIGDDMMQEPREESILPYAIDEKLPNCDATFSYTVTGDPVNGFTIKSVGKSGRAVKVICATAEIKTLFDNAILVQDRISLMPNTLVKGYNSADPADSDIDLKIGTTSTMADRIPLGPGTVVDGDVFVGVGGDPKTVIGPGGTITGEKYALPTEPEFPVITPPALPDTGAGLYAKGATLTVSPKDSGKYTDVVLAQGGGASGVVEISGGDVVLHITGNIDLGMGCEFIVRPGSSLTLYVDGNINTANSAGFSNENTDIAKLQLYATGGSEQIFDLKAKSKIFGVVYAPNVDINAYPSTELHGSITGNSVTMKSGCDFYYDEALRNGSLYNEGVRVAVKRWWEE